jgi:hypothetical protein
VLLTVYGTRPENLDLLRVNLKKYFGIDTTYAPSENDHYFREALQQARAKREAERIAAIELNKDAKNN